MSTVLAVFENGVFRPTEPVDLPDGRVVQVLLSAFSAEELATKPWLRAAGTMTKEDTDQILAAAEDAFGRVRADGWS